MKSLTDLEREALEVLYMVRDSTTRLLERKEFLDYMTHVRNTIMHLENKKYGCATGKHAGVCECVWPKGQS